MNLNKFYVKNWMSNIPDTSRINSLIIPGSHDAGMSELHHCHILAKCKPGMVQTQDLNIYDQLRAGARYLDIRIDYDHKNLVTYHRTGDIGCNGQKLDNILQESIKFLKENTQEFIILKFSHIRENRGLSDDIKSRIENFLKNNEYIPFIYTTDNADINLAEITVKECRGKILIVFDYPEYINSNTGRFRYNDFIENSINNKKLLNNVNLTIFDQYSNTANYEKMKEDQLSKLKKFGGLNNEYLFLLSWTLTLGATSVLHTIKELAEVAHGHLPLVLQQLKEESKPLPNIVYIDFVNEDICKEIIKYNFN